MVSYTERKPSDAYDTPFVMSVFETVISINRLLLRNQNKLQS